MSEQPSNMFPEAMIPSVLGEVTADFRKIKIEIARLLGEDHVLEKNSARQAVLEKLQSNIKAAEVLLAENSEDLAYEIKEKEGLRLRLTEDKAAASEAEHGHYDGLLKDLAFQLEAYKQENSEKRLEIERLISEQRAVQQDLLNKPSEAVGK